MAGVMPVAAARKLSTAGLQPRWNRSRLAPLFFQSRCFVPAPRAGSSNAQRLDCGAYRRRDVKRRVEPPFDPSRLLLVLPSLRSFLHIGAEMLELLSYAFATVLIVGGLLFVANAFDD